MHMKMNKLWYLASSYHSTSSYFNLNFNFHLQPLTLRSKRGKTNYKTPSKPHHQNVILAATQSVALKNTLCL